MSPHRRGVLTVLLLLACSGLVMGTGATYTAQTTNPSSLTADSLRPPTNHAVRPNGTQMIHTFTPNGFNGSTAYSTRALEMTPFTENDTKADGRDNATTGDFTPTCPAAASITAVAATTANGTFATLTDTSPGGQGLWTCYRIENRYPSGTGTVTWLSPNNPDPIAAQIGHVVRSIEWTDATNEDTLNSGDKFILTFNQPVNTATDPSNTNNTGGTPTSGNGICTRNNGGTQSTRNRIYIGRTAFGDCASETYWIGYITGVSPSQNSEYHASYVWPPEHCTNPPTNTACTRLEVTVGNLYGSGASLANITVGASPLFVPTNVSGKLANFNGTAAAVCSSTNVANSRHCQPTPFGEGL